MCLSGKNLQQMTKLTEDLRFWKEMTPVGGLPLPRVYIHIYMTSLKLLGQLDTDQDACHAHMAKTLQIFFFGTRSPMILKLRIDHQGLEVYKVFRNDNPGKTYFTARSKLLIMLILGPDVRRALTGPLVLWFYEQELM